AARERALRWDGRRAVIPESYGTAELGRPRECITFSRVNTSIVRPRAESRHRGRIKPSSDAVRLNQGKAGDRKCTNGPSPRRLNGWSRRCWLRRSLRRYSCDDVRLAEASREF